MRKNLSKNGARLDHKCDHESPWVVHKYPFPSTLISDQDATRNSCCIFIQAYFFATFLSFCLVWISENWVFPLFTEFFENFVVSLLKIQWDFQKSVSFYWILKEYPAEKGPGNSLKVLENRGKLSFLIFRWVFFHKSTVSFWILITEFFRKWWKISLP